MSELSVLMWVTLGEKFNYLPSLACHGPAQRRWSMTDIWERRGDKRRGDKRRGDERAGEEASGFKTGRQNQMETLEEEELWWKDSERWMEVRSGYKCSFHCNHHLTFTSHLSLMLFERYGRRFLESSLLESDFMRRQMKFHMNGFSRALEASRPSPDTSSGWVQWDLCSTRSQSFLGICLDKVRTRKTNHKI